jgi:hypothetical protein
MALTLIPRFALTVTLAALDEESKIVTREKTYQLEGADFATAQANRALFLADLALSTGANIVKHTLTEVYADSVAPTSVFNLWRELIVTVNLATFPLKKASHVIAAPSLNFVNIDSLNAGHADVTAYFNNFLETGGIVTMSDGEFITDANYVVKSRVRQTASGRNY